MARRSQVVVHGLVGGALAALVVALWFLVVDWVSAAPFRTPALLASVFLHRDIESVHTTFQLVLIYSLLHFGVFALLGAASAYLLESTGASPRILMGLIFGLAVLNTIHYGSLLAVGETFLTVLPAEHVVLTNLVGGIALMTYLHYALHPADPLGAALFKHPVLSQGLTAGLIGALVVALWFLVLDTLAGRPFYTPAALGAALLLGAAGPEAVELSLGIVGAYTVAHLAAFAVVGVGFAVAAQQLERAPNLWLLALLAFILVEVLFVAVAGTLADWVLGALGWWAVGLGNLLAVGSMGWWVALKRPELRQRLKEAPAPSV
ncbi:hypothetical protein HRbin33_01720 [bacterium HR33]|nr:hypothetical protein HRbin33_01720 [bacterium HR33]